VSEAQPAESPVDAFRLGVQQAFGTPWVVERTADGFVARYALRPPAEGEVTAFDEVHLRVTVDPGVRTFSWSTRRVAGRDVDRVRRGWSAGGYRSSRDVSSSSYSGRRRTWSFTRTPEGLAPNPVEPGDSAGRENDLRRVAAELGWTEHAAPSGGLGRGTSPPPKRQLILAGVFAAVVVLVILGVGIFVVTQVAGAFLR